MSVHIFQALVSLLPTFCGIMTKMLYLCVLSIIVLGTCRGIPWIQWGWTHRGRDLKWRYVSSLGSLSTLIRFQNGLWNFSVSIDLRETTADVEKRNQDHCKPHWEILSILPNTACTVNAHAVICPTLFICLGLIFTLESVPLENWGISLCVKEQFCHRPSPSSESYRQAVKSLTELMKNSVSPPLTHF